MSSSKINFRLSVIPENPGASPVKLVSEALNQYMADLISSMLRCHNHQDYETAPAFKRDIETISDLQFELVGLLADELDNHHTSGEEKFDWPSYRKKRSQKNISDYINSYISRGKQEGGQDNGK